MIVKCGLCNAVEKGNNYKGLTLQEEGAKKVEEILFNFSLLEKQQYSQDLSSANEEEELNETNKNEIEFE